MHRYAAMHASAVVMVASAAWEPGARSLLAARSRRRTARSSPIKQLAAWAILAAPAERRAPVVTQAMDTPVRQLVG
jgi:hypothetical protein